MKIHKSKSGSYYIRPYIFKNGVKKQTTYHFKTKEEALEKVLELKKGILTTKKTKNMDYTFEYLYLEFMSEKKRTQKPSTHYSYKKTADKHIYEHFKGMTINQIDRTQINNVVNYVNKLAVTARHKNKIVTILKNFLKYCVINYQTEHSWVQNLERFRDDTIKKQNEKKKYYSLEDFNKFMTGASELIDIAFFTVLFYSGLRMGEIRALTWNDWNNKNSSLNINKQLTSKTFDKEQLFTPKTKSSVRMVFLPKNANEILLKLKNNTTTKKSTDFIFNISETEIHRRNRKIAAAAGIERIKIHDFRHSYATLMVKLGMDAQTLQRQLGHSDIKVTFKYYVHHELEDQSKEVIRIFDDLKRLK